MRPFFITGILERNCVQKSENPDKYGENRVFKRAQNGIYPTIYPTKHLLSICRQSAAGDIHCDNFQRRFSFGQIPGERCRRGSPYGGRHKEIVGAIRRKVWTCCRSRRQVIRFPSL